MTRVVGVRGETPVAIPTTGLAGQEVLHLEDGDRPLVVWHKPGTASALDQLVIEQGADVGTTGVFVSLTPDGLPLRFEADGEGGFLDDGTGSTWNVLGEAVEGPLAGASLEPVDHLDTFWFAWATFVPNTEVYDGSERVRARAERRGRGPSGPPAESVRSRPAPTGMVLRPGLLRACGGRGKAGKSGRDSLSASTDWRLLRSL